MKLYGLLHVGLRASAAAVVFVSVAQAALIPSGAPINPGTNPAVGTGGRSVLTPAPAVYEIAGSCPWLVPALNAEGFSKANGWTINTQALQGNIQLNTYNAWVNSYGQVTAGGMTVAATNAPGDGGAGITLTYQPNTNMGTTDPSGAGVHWISVIYDNKPTAFEKANGAAYSPGYTVTLDNGYLGGTKVPNNPFYDGVAPATGYAGNSTTFIDVPDDVLRSNADIEFQTFIATWNPNDANDRTKGGTITIYDGVWWGFQLPVPEPSTWVMLIMGGGGVCIAAFRSRPARRRH